MYRRSTAKKCRNDVFSVRPRHDALLALSFCAADYQAPCAMANIRYLNPMIAYSIMVELASPEATNRFASDLAKRLKVGDAVLLGGPIGAGKTHFARALIQSLLPVPEDVPSPTFTLVQTYQIGVFELWHADLYRLSGPKEVIELGMLEAFEGAITLVEWPDRLGNLKPDTALHIDFGQGPAPDSRTATLHWKGGIWPDRLKDLDSAPS